MSIVALAALVPVLVGLPPGAVAPAPGALPPGARVEALDPTLGIVRVELPRAGLARSVARLKAAPGTRYVEADEPMGLAAKGGTCPGLGKAVKGPSLGWWKAAINLPARKDLPSVDEVVIGVADTGADLERLGTRVGNAISRDFTGANTPREDVTDQIGHGTLVASLIAADRKPAVEGVAVGAPLAVARVARLNKCGLAGGLISAMTWFRDVEHPSVVSVSIVMEPTRALRESLRSLQLGGSLVVAAAGNFGDLPIAGRTFPWAEPGVLAVGSVRSRTRVAKSSTRSPRIDLVAPGPGVPAISSVSSNKAREDHDPRRHIVRNPDRGCRGCPRRRQAPELDARQRGVGAASERPPARPQSAQSRMGMGRPRRAQRAPDQAAVRLRRAERLGRGRGATGQHARARADEGLDPCADR